MVDILTDRRGWKDFDGEAVVLGVFEPKPDALLGEINRLLDGAIDHVIKKKEFTGEFGQVKLVNTLKRLPCEHILLVGLGKRDDFGLEQLRRASGIAARVLRDNGIPVFATTLHNVPARKATLREQAQAVVEGIILGAYQFTKYRTLNREKIKELKSITLLEAEKAAEEGAKAGKIIADCQNYARDLVNEPGSSLTPARLAEEALALKKLGVKVTVYDKEGIKRLGLNGLLAVSRGSAEEPRFILLEYKKGNSPLVAIVGKGLTFDSGGLDIKQPQFMESMHDDMAGGAAIICAIKALALLGANANVVGIIPSAENMPGCHAYKPGDIITAYNGKTIEVGNTDAEGRIILADAVGYAERHYKPKYIVDIATLTGACIVALGYFAAGLMSRDAAVSYTHLTLPTIYSV